MRRGGRRRIGLGLDLAQGHADAETGGLELGLLLGPDAEKGAVSRFGRRAERTAASSAGLKNRRANRLRLGDSAEPLDVDADLAWREGEHHDVARSARG